MDITELNQRFSITDQLVVTEGEGGLPFIEVKNEQATAIISLYGGQVLSYKKQHGEELLFLSRLAYYKQGKAIKGGVPVCWPWFGADPENKGRPAHGFARNKMWQIRQTEKLSATKTKVILGLSHDNETMDVWPHEFDLKLEIVVGDKLELSLITDNLSDKDIKITQALHTYFSVKDIQQVSIKGLDGGAYLDKAKSNTGAENRTQAGDVVFAHEVDRIYLDVAPELIIDDAARNKQINISSSGNKTAIVWNPWQQICREMADLEDADYQRFVCVETANAADDVISIAPGGQYRLAASYHN